MADGDRSDGDGGGETERGRGEHAASRAKEVRIQKRNVYSKDCGEKK